MEALPVLSILLGGATFFGARLFVRLSEKPRLAALGLSLVAAALSGVWIFAYLRGGPRIIDATAYWLSGRAFAEGHLSWPVGEPPASTMGRFLVRDTLGSGQNASVIFPPGYPAVLALGFAVGAPLLVGPLLGAALCWLTFDLTRTAARLAGLEDASRLALVAALLSVVCGAVRYHTADTMSHGLTAVCVTAALAAALRLRQGAPARWAVVAGAALGLAAATRPVSGAALALLMAIAWGRPRRLGDLALVAGAAAPSLALLYFHQLAATGAPLSSSQSLYYAASDGPAGCFRYGFGQGIGCVHEHGDFVRANLSDGYGFVAALGTTARRLKMHGVDALNAEPLAVVVLLPALVLALRSPKLRVLGLALPVFVVAYAPFYFDGNYPGGGARFFADVLPVEHALVALALPHLTSRVKLPTASTIVVGLSLLGFGLRAHADHASLRDREGGRPMFDPRHVDGQGGGLLVFVDTDHGFLLGFDPDKRADRGEVEVVRYRGDANDWLLWEERGRPRALRHRYDVSSGWVLVEPYVPRSITDVDGISLWPPLRQVAGYALPSGAAPGCGRGGRGLHIEPGPDGRAQVEVALPSGIVGATLSVAARLPEGGRVHLILQADGRELASAEERRTSDDCVMVDIRVTGVAAHPSLLVSADAPVVIAAVGEGQKVGEDR